MPDPEFQSQTKPVIPNQSNGYYQDYSQTGSTSGFLPEQEVTSGKQDYGNSQCIPGIEFNPKRHSFSLDELKPKPISRKRRKVRRDFRH